MSTSYNPLASVPCPTCGAEAKAILYGRPDAKGRRLAEAGKVHLGGCVMGLESPSHRCETGHTFVTAEERADREELRALLCTKRGA